MTDSGLNLTREDIENMSSMLAQVLLEHMPQEENKAPLLHMYVMIPQQYVVETINLDYLASSELGLTDPVGQIVQAVASFIDGVASWIVSSIKGVIDTVASAVRSVGDAIIGAIRTVVETIQSAISTIASSILSAISSAISTISGVISSLATTLSSAISGAVSTISSFISSVVSTITSLVQSISVTVTNAISGVVSAITSAIASFSSTIVGALSGLASSILNAISSVASTIASVIGSIASFIANAISGIISAISGFVSSLMNAISGIASSIINSISGIASFIANTISKLASGFIDAIGKLGSTIISAFSTAISSMYTSIVSLMTSVVSTITQGISNFAGIVTSAIEKVSRLIVDFASLVGKAISNAFSSFADTITNVIQGIAKGLFDAIAGIGGMFPVILGVLQDIITKVGSGFQIIGQTFTGFINGILHAGQLIAETILKGVDFFIRSIPAWFMDAMKSIADFFSTIARDPLGWLKANLVEPLINGFNTLVKWIWDNIPDWLKGAFQRIGDFFTKDLVNFFTKDVPAFFQWLSKGFEEFFRDPLGWLQKNLIDPLVKGLNALGQWIWNALPDWLKGALERIRDFFTKDIPSFFEWLMGGLEAFFKDPLGWLQKNLVDPVWDALKKFGEWLWSILPDWFKNALTAVYDFFSGIVKGLQDFISDPLGFLKKHVADPIWNAFNQFAKWVWDVIPNWFKDAWNAITDFFTNVAKGIVDFFKDPVEWFKTKVISPLVDGFKEIWKWLLDYFVDPLQKYVKTIWEVFTTDLLPGWKIVWEKVPGFFESKSISGFEALTWSLIASVTARPYASINIGDITRYWVASKEIALGKVEKELPAWLTSPSLLFEPLISSFVRFVKPVIDQLWEHLKSAFETLAKTLTEALKALAETVLGLLKTMLEGLAKTLIDTITGLYNALGEAAEKLGKFYETEHRKVVDQMIVVVRDVMVPQVNTLLKEFGISSPEFLKIEKTEEAVVKWSITTLGLMTMPFWAQLPVRMMRKALHIMGKYIAGKSLPVSALLRPFGIGVSWKFDIAKAFGYGVSHFSRELKYFLDRVFDAYAYGLGIWTSQPISKMLNYYLRNIVPVEIPTVDQMTEIVRRAMSLIAEKRGKDFEDLLKLAKLYTAMQGFPDTILNLLYWKEDEYSVTIMDRFQKERKIPLSTMYVLPSPSDVARMVIRDIILEPEAIRKVFAARGMNKDIADMYYLLHFRYPPPERLWTFYTRGISGLLWARKSREEEDILKREAQSIGAFPPVSPAELNFASSTLDNLLKTYMKWHDYARFCLPEGTVILGDNKPIESYKVGDYTLYGGRVTATFKRPYKGKIVRVKAHGLLELRATPEHILPVVTGRYEHVWLNGKTVWFFKSSKPYYKRIGELKPRSSFASDRDYLLVPILSGIYDTRELDLSRYIEAKTDVRNTRLRLDEETAWFLGLYLAEGHSQEKYISIGQSSEARGVIEKLCNIIRKLGYSPVVSKSRHVTEVYVKSPILSRAFSEWFGRGARNKRIPDFILLHKDRKILEAFLDGYLAGDGWVDRHHGEHRLEKHAVTASKVLAMQLQLLLLRLGYVATVHHVRRLDHYHIRFIPREHTFKWIKIQGDYALFPVHRIDYEEYDGYVYDLEVENHHYLASNAIIHNSYGQGWPSDNLIVIDTLADIPTKIDQRWMVRFGLYELLSERGVKHSSKVEEFVSKVVEGTAKGKITLDLTNFCRTLQATGLHPYYVPITAVAETINAITDERTLLRTGVVNLFKEGFFNTSSVMKMLTGVLTVSFNVAYFNPESGSWSTGVVNVPLRYLDMEARLIGLRAIMDRALDILRDIQRDVLTGYQEFIIETYDEFKEKFTQVINNINTVYASDFQAITGESPPKELTIRFIEEYYKPYVDALSIWRDIWTVRRIRMWTQRWLGWLMYRIGYGVAKKEEIEQLVDFMVKACKLPQLEREYILKVMEYMMKLSLREYIPTPPQLATLTEYIKIDNAIILKAFEERGIPEEWREFWKKYIEVRPLADDIRGLLSSYRRLLVYAKKVGKIPGEIEGAVKSLMSKIGFTEQEMDIFDLRVTIEEMIAQLKEYVPTPMQMATLSEFIKLPSSLVDMVFEIRNIPPEWRTIWKNYIDIRPLADDVRDLIRTYLRAIEYVEDAKAMEGVVMGYARKIGFGADEINILQTRVRLEEMIYNSREYIPTPPQLATIVEVLPHAREYFDDVVKKRRVPANWQKLWQEYIDIKPLIDDLKNFLARSEQLYVRFMVKKDDFVKMIKDVVEMLGYTQKEQELLLKITELERWRNAWSELIGSVERLVSLSEYSPRASKYALGKMYEMIDSLPLPPTERDELKKMWEEYIRNRPVKSEARTYITQLSNLYAEGLVSDLEFSNELEAMKQWGFSDDEIMFYKARAALMKARKMKIPIGG